MTKFTIALREIGTYKEVLRSQVHMMSWRFSPPTPSMKCVLNSLLEDVLDCGLENAANTMVSLLCSVAVAWLFFDAWVVSYDISKVGSCRWSTCSMIDWRSSWVSIFKMSRCVPCEVLPHAGCWSLSNDKSFSSCWLGFRPPFSWSLWIRSRPPKSWSLVGVKFVMTHCILWGWLMAECQGWWGASDWGYGWADFYLVPVIMASICLMLQRRALCLSCLPRFQHLMNLLLWSHSIAGICKILNITGHKIQWKVILSWTSVMCTHLR